jgi:SNF2 family DNA or RNA helicase
MDLHGFGEDYLNFDLPPDFDVMNLFQNPDEGFDLPQIETELALPVEEAGSEFYSHSAPELHADLQVQPKSIQCPTFQPSPLPQMAAQDGFHRNYTYPTLPYSNSSRHVANQAPTMLHATPVSPYPQPFQGHFRPTESLTTGTNSAQVAHQVTKLVRPTIQQPINIDLNFDFIQQSASFNLDTHSQRILGLFESINRSLENSPYQLSHYQEKIKKYNLFNYIVSFKNEKIFEYVRNHPLIFFLIYNHEPEITPSELLDILPLACLSNTYQIKTLVRLGCLSKISLVVQEGTHPRLPMFVAELKKLDFFSTEMFDVYNSDSKCESIALHLIKKIWNFYPRTLIKNTNRKGAYSIQRNSCLAKFEMPGYEGTFVHFLCNRSGSARYWPGTPGQVLHAILECHPNAFDWKDSNGYTIFDIARTHELLRNWLRSLIPQYPQINEKMNGLPQSSPIAGEKVSASIPTKSIEPLLLRPTDEGEIAVQPPSLPLDETWPPKKHRIKHLLKLYREIVTVIFKKKRTGLDLHKIISETGHVRLLFDRLGITGIPKNNLSVLEMNFLKISLLVLLNNFSKELELDAIPAEIKEGLGFLGNQQRLAFIPPKYPLSSRQKNEIIGAIQHLKYAEISKNMRIERWMDLYADIQNNFPGCAINTVPILVIRQEIDLFHAEIVAGHFTQGNRLIGVTSDVSGSMSTKIQQIIGPEFKVSNTLEGDRIAKITVEEMDRLTTYCKHTRGLNLLILPRITLPEPVAQPIDPEESIPKPSIPQHRERKSDPDSSDDFDHVSKKRVLPPKLPLPKKQRAEVAIESLDPEILPNNPNNLKVGLQSIGGLVIGKHERDLDDMQEPKKAKRSAKDIPDDELFIPGASRKNQGQESIVADFDDPAADLKNLSFQLIQMTVEGVRNAQEIKRIIDGEKIRMPIEDKLVALPSIQEPFLFSNLYSYQAADLKRILQLQGVGVFPLISYRMGLGKTYVYIELIMQQLLINPKGIHLVVVPKSLLPQAFSDIHKGLNNAKATSWSALFASNYQLALDTLKRVLNPQEKTLDSSAILSILPSIHLIRDDLVLKNYLARSREIIRSELSHYTDLFQLLTQLHQLKDKLSFNMANTNSLLNQIALEASKVISIAKNGAPFSDHQLPRLANLILFRSDSILQIAAKVKPGQGTPFIPGRIILTKYHQVANLADQPNFDQLDSLTIDEAQKVNRKKNEMSKDGGPGLHQAIQSCIRVQKKSGFKPNIVTATPFENEFSELWTLLELANPQLFPSETLNSLLVHVRLIEKLFSNIHKLQNINTKSILDVFVEFYRLKKTIEKSVIFLTQKEASKKYGTKFPRPRKINLELSFNPVESEKINSITKNFIKKNAVDRLNYFNFLARINSIITHPIFIDKQLSTTSAEFIKLKARIENNENQEVRKKVIKDVIQESPLLRALDDSEPFNEIFKNKKKGLLIIDNIAPGELVQMVANAKYGHYTKFYNGKLSEVERNRMVSWFKDGVGEPRLLILSIEAGGVGLNLPESDLVIEASKSYNPWQIKQARDRAFRSGYEGMKPVYKIVYDSSFFSLHIDTIHKIKKIWVKSLFQFESTYKNELALWMKVRVAEAMKLVLNFDKEIDSFEVVRMEIERGVNEILDSVSEGDLQALIQTALPAYLTTKILHASDFYRIPIPYGFSREEVELFTFAYKCKSDDRQLLELKTIAFESWKIKVQTGVNPEELRRSDYLEGHPFFRYKNHIKNVINRMKALGLQPLPSYEFIAKTQETYECSRWPETADPTNAIFLYCRQGPENRPHFEALIAMGELR